MKRISDKTRLIEMLNDYTEMLAAREMTTRPWVEQLIKLRDQCREVTADIDGEIECLSQQIIEAGTKLGEDVHGRQHSLLIDRLPSMESGDIIELAQGKMSLRKAIRYNTYVHIVKCGKKAAKSS